MKNLNLAGIFSVSTTVSDWLPGALSSRSLASSLLTGWFLFLSYWLVSILSLLVGFFLFFSSLVSFTGWYLFFFFLSFPYWYLLSLTYTFFFPYWLVSILFNFPHWYLLSLTYTYFYLFFKCPTWKKTWELPQLSSQPKDQAASSPTPLMISPQGLF